MLHLFPDFGGWGFLYHCFHPILFLFRAHIIDSYYIVALILIFIIRDPRDHDDVIKWKHFPRYWPFVRGIHRSPVNSTHKGQWRGALMLPLICVWTNAWVSNRDAGDLRRNRVHYDVTEMTTLWPHWSTIVYNLTTTKHSKTKQNIESVTFHHPQFQFYLILIQNAPTDMFDMAIRHFGPVTEPQHPAKLADTYLQISLMVTDIQNISHFRWNRQSFAFSITGAVSVPMFGGPLDLWFQDLWSHYRV